MQLLGKQLRLLIVSLSAACAIWGGTEYPAKPGEAVVPNQLLVRYLPGTTISSINATLVAGAQIQAVSASLPGVFLVTLPSGTDPSFSTTLSQHVLVDYVEPNRIRQLSIAAPNDSQFASQFALTNVHAQQAWQLLPNAYLTSATPELGRIRVAVLDSGADCTHPDFKNASGSSADAASGGQILFSASKAIVATTIANPTCTWQDDNGHGTHVSGTIAAATNNSTGVASLAYPVELIEFKTQDASGSGNDHDLAAAILLAVTAGANVISMSLGGPSYGQTLQDAINTAWQHNVVIIAAAGNGGSSSPSYPAANNHVLGVAATDSNDIVAGFSNSGPPIGIAAPGVLVLSTEVNSNYGLMSGTSMATPHVAALAGLIEMTTPNLSAMSVVQRIQRSADNVHSTANGGWDASYGYGRINAFGGVSGTLRSSSAGSIVGQVVNAAGTPIGSVTVSIPSVPGQTVTTSAPPGATGMYRLSNLAPGTYTVTASALNQVTVNLKAAVVAGADTNLTIVMGAVTGEFHGTVSGPGGAIAGAVVQAVSGGVAQNSAVTDGTGAYSLVVVPPGTYDLHASAVGCINSTTASQTVIASGSTAANISMPCMGTIGGKIVDGNNNPINGVQISVASTSTSLTAGAVTDANGNYSTIPLPAGNYTVTATSGSLSGSASVAVTNDHVTTVNMTLGAAVTVATNPPGLTIVVDSTTFTAPHSFTWVPGSGHTIAVSSPQNASSAARLVWSNWSDGQAMSHSITVPGSGSATYTANFTQQYFLTMTAGAGGSVSPSSNWFNVGQSVGILATANGGATFSSWSGTGPGSFSGGTPSASVTMNGAISETASFTIALPGAAAFVKQDGTTQGNWVGAYGSDGYNVIGDQALNPAYVTPAPSGQNPFTWVSSTSDPRALRKASNPADRIAATWYTGSFFTVDLPITDTGTHQLAVYCLDWDTPARRETVDILDANGNVLNSQSLTGSFNGGVYLVWNVSGHVKVRVTVTGGFNAVISGIFFGPGSAPSSPALSISKTHSGNFTAGQQGVYSVSVSNAAGAASSSGTVTVTETIPSGLTLVSMSGSGWSCGGNTCSRGDALGGGSSYSPIAVTVNVGAGASSPQVNQVSVSGGGSVSASTTDSTVISSGGSAPSSASFVKLDSTTQGNWRGIYGGDGYNVLGDQLLNPGYVTPAPSGQNPFAWAPSTSDARALQKASNPSDRVAAGWYTGSSFLVDLPISDSSVHQLAFYCLDWDTTSRRETVDILDANGNVLSSQSLTGSFSGGVYLVWNVTGHVKARVTLTGGPNAVISGLFFGAAGSSGGGAGTAAFVKVDAATQGNWRGVYGGDGYNVLGDQLLNPGYVTPAPSGNNPFTWAPSTSDARASQKASNPSDRVAAGWYTGSSFIVDLPITDTATHQLAVYCLDWDTTSRRETVDILDANGNVLSSQSLTGSFSGGVYLVWNISGHVKVRVTVTGGPNAVISGLFFGAAGSGNPASSSASFLQLDTTTRGNWHDVYGLDGYNVLSDQSSNPSYVTPAPSGNNPFTWATSTGDVRALQKPSNLSDRVAGGWYTGSSFLVDLPITDANTHQLAVYCLDWDTTARREQVDILDANGNVLNSQSLSSSFGGGVYLVWNVAGHVKIRVTMTGGANAVISGIFFR